MSKDGRGETMAKVKGSKISSKFAFVRKEFGDEGVDRVLARFSDDEAAELRRIIDLRWYPFELYDRVLHAIVETVGHGNATILDRIGAHSAEHQLQNIYASYKRDDLVRMLKNMVPMHMHMNDPAHMDVKTDNTAECSIIVTEPKSSEWACRVSRAFYKRVTELAGGKQVRVDETTCTARGDAACRFDVHAG